MGVPPFALQISVRDPRKADGIYHPDSERPLSVPPRERGDPACLSVRLARGDRGAGDRAAWVGTSEVWVVVKPVAHRDDATARVCVGEYAGTGSVGMGEIDRAPEAVGLYLERGGVVSHALDLH